MYVLNSNQWADIVAKRLEKSIKAMAHYQDQMAQYDKANWWGKIRRGGRLYRAYLDNRYQSEVDELVSNDLGIRD